ncbi:MAG TPA: hypothetical protein VFU05_19970 [Cyclobacteriaceae bacterium]|nr:hypothetical protein [Cyclobacteriaceae bacterium]
MILPRNNSNQIDQLILFLNLAKQNILNFVLEISTDELDYAVNRHTPTIGTLLKHIIAMEYLIQLKTFEKRGFNAKEASLWQSALPGPNKMLDRAIRGNPVTFYTKLWMKTRNATIKRLRGKEESWLYEVDGGYNNYFMWYHLLEDHLCHFGQIKAIAKRIPTRRQKLTTL